MLLLAAHDPELATVTLGLAESCHTDALPLVSDVFFRNAAFDVGSQGFALAATILTRDYLGDHITFADVTLGLDYARALRTMCPWVVALTAVDGMDRAPSAGEIDVVCTPARLRGLASEPTDGYPLLSIDWTGDSLVPGTRSSAGFRYGRYFTNAGLLADETTVSIAIGLMHAGTTCRNLHVPLLPGADLDRLAPVRAALAIIGIALHLVAAT